MLASSSEARRAGGFSTSFCRLHPADVTDRGATGSKPARRAWADDLVASEEKQKTYVELPAKQSPKKRRRPADENECPSTTTTCRSRYIHAARR